MASGSGAGFPSGTPDVQPDHALERAASPIIDADALCVAVFGNGPECPSCGAEMSRFPLVVFCGMCEFYIEAPGRSASESMRPLRDPVGVGVLF